MQNETGGEVKVKFTCMTFKGSFDNKNNSRNFHMLFQVDEIRKMVVNSEEYYDAYVLIKKDTELTLRFENESPKYFPET